MGMWVTVGVCADEAIEAIAPSLALPVHSQQKNNRTDDIIGAFDDCTLDDASYMLFRCARRSLPGNTEFYLRLGICV